MKKTNIMNVSITTVSGSFSLKFAGLFLALAFVLSGPFGSGLQAEKYLPPGYGSGVNVEGVGWDFDAGYKQVGEDYYITLKPLVELPFFLGMRIGLQVPLEILAVDNEPTGTQSVPSVRLGTYDTKEDYLKLIAYIRYGTHLYYNPEDTFNWSFFYGQMTDGWMGHKTIIYRYYSTFDPTVYRPGLMADVNNNWGGIEVFSSDTFSKEVWAGRGYIRPMGIFYSVRDMVLARSFRMPDSQLAHYRSTASNGGVFFLEEEDKRKTGRIGQRFHKKIGDENFDGEDTEVKFEEYTDPVTGKTQVRAVKTPIGGDEDPSKGGSGDPSKSADKSGDPSRGGGKSGDPTKGGSAEERKIADGEDADADEKKEKWGPTFWSRWAIGYTIARDLTAPVAKYSVAGVLESDGLERDGSNNLVIDPDTKRPRTDNEEAMTIVGYDTEFRLSPYDWMDMTPYVDLNRVKDLDNSEGLHVGVDMGFRFLNRFVKVSFRPEYREFTDNYIPVYFDTYYSVERTAYIPDGNGSTTGIVGDDTQTKLTYLRSLSSEGGKTKGYFVELIVELLQVLVVEGTYQNYDGPNNSTIFFGFYVPDAMGFFMNGYYTKKGFEDIGESFQFDDRSLAAAELGYNFFGAFYVKAGIERTWTIDESTSTYVANDEKTINFGFSGSL